MIRQILQHINEVKLEPWGDVPVPQLNSLPDNFRNSSTPELSNLKPQLQTQNTQDLKIKTIQRVRFGKTTEVRKRAFSYQIKCEQCQNSQHGLQKDYSWLLNKDNQEDTVFKPLNAIKKTLDPFNSKQSNQKEEFYQNPLSLKTVFLGYIDTETYTSSKKNPIRQFLHNRKLAKYPISNLKTSQMLQNKSNQPCLQTKKRPLTMATHRTIEHSEIKNSKSFYVKRTLSKKQYSNTTNKTTIKNMQNERQKANSSKIMGKNKEKYLIYQKKEKHAKTNEYNNFLVKSFKVKRAKKSSLCKC